MRMLVVYCINLCYGYSMILSITKVYKISSIKTTRQKPVGHGYVFSMAIGTIGEWLKLVPYFVRGRTVDWGGGRFLGR